MTGAEREDASRTVRQARPGDVDAVTAFTADTWPDREAGDYLPEVFPEWVGSDGPRQRTAVVECEGRVVACCQARLLGADEGWLRGMRVHPDHRGAGHGRAVSEHLLDWCRGRGATVARNLVFDWNGQGMGQSRAAGFDPVASCRFVRVTAADRAVDLEVSHDPDAAWTYWTGSDARTGMNGLALADEEPWAFAELTRERTRAAAPLALLGDGLEAAALRLGVRDPGYREGRVADYAAAAWEGGRARPLFDAVRADGAAAGADEARVVVPETPRHVSGAALARADLDQGGLVFGADLTRR